MFSEEGLNQLNFQSTKTISSKADEKVELGTYNNKPAVLKTQLLSQDTNVQELLNRIQLFKELNHENITKIYFYGCVRKNRSQYLVTVMEDYGKSFETDMEQRLANKFPYSEKELWEMMATLIRAFAYMQKQGIAHRNIKPGNLFLAGKTIKIANFRSIRKVDGFLYELFTLKGTPTYLSPLLRQGYLSGQQRVYHDPYKSDVYSLGITFLELARLQAPFNEVQGGDMAIQSALDFLPIGMEVKGMIRWMLALNEADRPDFVQLESLFLPAQVPSVPRSLQMTRPVQAAQVQPRVFVNTVQRRPLPATPANDVPRPPVPIAPVSIQSSRYTNNRNLGFMLLALVVREWKFLCCCLVVTLILALQSGADKI